MEYVIGWVRVKPGMRQAFLDASQPLIAASRLEEGIDFFEFHLSPEDPDVIVVIERYASAATHRAHLETAHFADFLGIIEQYVVHGRFENVVADTVRVDTLGAAEAS